MLKVLAVRGSNEADTADTLRLFVTDLADIPIERVAPVIRAFRAGKIGDGKWAPRPGEIRREVYAQDDRKAKAERDERLVAETLEARREAAERAPRTLAEKARAQELVEAFKREVGPSASRPREMTPGAARAALVGVVGQAAFDALPDRKGG